MWQGDPVSGAKVIIECLDKVHVPAAGPSHDGRRRASDQLNVAE